jgi:deoxyinosine 3'endonuclease (endonuclease V)
MVPRSTSDEQGAGKESCGAPTPPHQPPTGSIVQRQYTVAQTKGDPASDRYSFPSSLTSQREIWKLEQRVVAALVRVNRDPPQDIISWIQDNPLFRLVPENHNDEFSFSTVPELYGGVDVSFPDSEDDEAVAVYVVVDQRTMKVVYQSHKYFVLDVPYVPGFLAFREIVPLECLVQQQIQHYPAFTPKAILVDGNGILHPRHAGIACFLGTRTDIPTIGVGKSLLNVSGWTRDLVAAKVEQFVREVHNLIGSSHHSFAESLARLHGTIMQKIRIDGNSQDGCHDACMKPHAEGGFNLPQALGDLSPYCNALAIPLSNDPSVRGADDDTDPKRFPVLGCAVVGQGGQFSASRHSKPVPGSSKPIFVSVGHGISLQEAVQIVASLSVHRIPEPVRQADLYGREIMRNRADAQRIL